MVADSGRADVAGRCGGRPPRAETVSDGGGAFQQVSLSSVRNDSNEPWLPVENVGLLRLFHAVPMVVYTVEHVRASGEAERQGD